MNRVFIFIIGLYRRFISPIMMSRCRFYPTCSEYAIQAFEEYSFSRAFYLTTKRLFRCQPLCKGGVDPLPTPQNKNG
ncbi:MAG: membrane protein insertion efficiency factor YidD [Cycloclasticus sp. symbiont of Poecilosclerida sp. N]|nr:MAG: membrane protein insertion efficiency factor YidD [Cycloclasticus sp. symbiont of Poecilosclerida sp. N]